MNLNMSGDPGGLGSIRNPSRSQTVSSRRCINFVVLVECSKRALDGIWIEALNHLRRLDYLALRKEYAYAILREWFTLQNRGSMPLSATPKVAISEAWESWQANDEIYRSGWGGTPRKPVTNGLELLRVSLEAVARPRESKQFSPPPTPELAAG